MKIGELRDRCGECSIMDFCTDPWETPKICASKELADIEEDDYIGIAETLKECGINKMRKAILKEDYGYDRPYKEAIKRLVIKHLSEVEGDNGND